MINNTKWDYFRTSRFLESASYAEEWATIHPMRTAGWLQKRGRNFDCCSVVTQTSIQESTATLETEVEK